MKSLLSSLLLQAALFAVSSVDSGEDRLLRTHHFDLSVVRQVEISEGAWIACKQALTNVADGLGMRYGYSRQGAMNRQ